MFARVMTVLCALGLGASPAFAADKPMGKIRTAFYSLAPVKAAFQMAVKPQCRAFATPVAQGSAASETYGIGNVTVKTMHVSPLLNTYSGTASVVIGVGTSIRGPGPITSEVLFTGPKPTLGNLAKCVGIGLGLVQPAQVPVHVEADQPVHTLLAGTR